MNGERGTPGAKVYRIDWVPGADTLHGVCHCGAEHRATDPIAMWEWMFGHPLGHDAVQDDSTVQEGTTDER